MSEKQSSQPNHAHPERSRSTLPTEAQGIVEPTTSLAELMPGSQRQRSHAPGPANVQAARLRQLQQLHGNAYVQRTIGANHVQRDMAGAMQSVAQGSETALPDAGSFGSRVISVSNVGDIESARQLRQRLDSFDSNLMTAIRAGDVPQSAWTSNDEAKRALDTYLAQAGIESATISDFQAHYLRTMRDNDRFDQQVQLYFATRRGAALGQRAARGEFATATGGGAFADALVQSVGLSDADRARMARVGSGDGSVNLSDTQRLHAEMMTASGQVAQHQSEMTGASQLVLAAQNRIGAGLPVLQTPEAERSAQELRAKVARIRGYVSGVINFVSTKIGGIVGSGVTGAISGIATAAGVPASMSSGVASSLGDAAGSQTGNLVADFLGYLATLPWQSDLAEANARATAAFGAQNHYAYQEQVTNLNAQWANLSAKAQQYLTTAERLETTKRAFRQAIVRLGQQADGGRGRNGEDYAILASLLGEADTLLAQANTTLNLGRNEQMSASQTRTANEAAQGRGLGGGRWEGGLPYFEPRQVYHPVADYYSWVVDRGRVAFYNRSADANRSTRTTNATVEEAITQLQLRITTITQIRDRLAQEFPGLSIGSVGSGSTGG